MNKTDMYYIVSVTEDGQWYDSKLMGFTNNRKEIKRLLIDFSKNYNPGVSTNIADSAKEHRANLIAVINDSISKLNDLWKSELKSKEQHYRNLPSIDRREYDAAMNIIYLSQIAKSIDQVKDKVSDIEKDLQTRIMTHLLKTCLKVDITWKNTQTLVDELTFFKAALIEPSFMTKLVQSYVTSIDDYLSTHPEELIKFARERNYDVDLKIIHNHWDTSFTLNADRTHITDVSVSDYEEWQVNSMVEHVYRLGSAELPKEYAELCVIVNNGAEINRLLVDFSDQYEPELPDNFDAKFDQRLGELLAQIDQAIKDLSGFYATSIKNKLDYFNTLSDDEQAKYSSEISKVYNYQLRHRISELEGYLQQLQISGIDMFHSVGQFKKPHWRIVKQMIKQLKQTKIELQKPKVKEQVKNDQLDGVADHILKHPDELIDFTKQGDYDLKVIVLGEDYSTEFYTKSDYIHLDHVEFIDNYDIQQNLTLIQKFIRINSKYELRSILNHENDDY